MRATALQKSKVPAGVALSNRAIIELLHPLGPHRLSRRRYPAGASFSGVTRHGWCFVDRGACTLRLDVELLLSAGEFVEFSAGDYDMTASGKGILR